MLPSAAGSAATHAHVDPAGEGITTGVPGARAPFAPAGAGGVSAGVGGWAVGLRRARVYAATAGITIDNMLSI